ncbi:MAG: AbrB/MazE/SpoVT family DNA-binding domain-containing protein [Clostridia bacterium]
MNNSGIVRSLDDLGRIVIPKELRKVLKLGYGDLIEISSENNNIILKKFQSFDYLEFLHNIVTVFDEQYKTSLLICNTNKIIAGKLKSRNDCNVSNELIKALNGNSLPIELNIKITEFSSKESSYIHPIKIKDKLQGAIILPNNDKDKLESLIPVITLLANFIEKELEF